MTFSKITSVLIFKLDLNSQLKKKKKKLSKDSDKRTLSDLLLLKLSPSVHRIPGRRNEETMRVDQGAFICSFTCFSSQSPGTAILIYKKK